MLAVKWRHSYHSFPLCTCSFLRQVAAIPTQSCLNALVCDSNCGLQNGKYCSGEYLEVKRSSFKVLYVAHMPSAKEGSYDWPDVLFEPSFKQKVTIGKDKIFIL